MKTKNSQLIYMSATRPNATQESANRKKSEKKVKAI